MEKSNDGWPLEKFLGQGVSEDEPMNHIEKAYGDLWDQLIIVKIVPGNSPQHRNDPRRYTDDIKADSQSYVA